MREIATGKLTDAWLYAVAPIVGAMIAAWVHAGLTRLVGVDVDTGEVRLRRMLGVFTAGRVLNQKTARSRAIGGMIFGVGAALEEGLNLDCRFGYHVNHDLAEYHVPVHADVPCPQRDCAALVWLAQHRLAQPGADRNRIGRLRDLAVRERPA